jgi:outer membrane biosynthesis protein TonB
MASFLEYRSQDWDNRRLWVALALSLLLHGLVAILLLIEPWTWRVQPEPPPVLAEFVMPEASKPAPRLAPQAAPPPPAPTPPAQQPRVVEELKDVPPPSVPQLQQAPVTQDPSRAPPSSGQRARPQPSDRPQPAPMLGQSGPTTTPAPPQQAQRTPPSQQTTGNRQRGAPGAAAGEAGAMTQSESDFFLSQIQRAWVLDFDAPRFADIRIFGRYRVLADGMLAPPFGKDDPWDMRRMVENWDRIANDPRPEAAAFRTAVETFLRAMRLAQPLKMPPNAEGYPKVLELNFRIGDL